MEGTAGSRSWRPLLAVMAVAAAIRLAWVMAADVAPRAHFNFDATWYDLMAGLIAAGHGFGYQGQGTAAWPPGYPFMLGMLYRVFGGDILVAQLANVVLGTLTAGVTCELGRRLFGPRVGWIGGLVLAVSPGHVFFSALPMSEVLFGLLFAAACLLFALWSVRPGVSAVRWGLWGAVIGACTLVRGTTLAFPAIPVCLWLLERRDLRQSVLRSAAVVLGFSLVVGPWMVRNLLVLDEFVLVSTSFGRTLAIAHLPRGSYEERHRELDRTANEVEMDRLQQEEVFDHLRAHPWTLLTRIPTHVRRLYHGDDVALNWARVRRAGSRQRRPILPGVPDGWVAGGANALHLGILAFALLGLPAACARGRPDRWILPAAILYLTLLHTVVFHGNPRFHIPFAPQFAVLAAAGGVQAAGWLRRRHGAAGASGAT